MKLKKATSLLSLLLLCTALLLSGCGNKTSSNAKSVSEMADLIKSSMSFDYYPDMEADSEVLETIFGLTPDMYDDYFCEIPAISVLSDTLLIVKPADGKKDAVLSALQSYLDYEQNEAMQYPVNAVQAKASTVYEAGGYIYYLALFGDVSTAESDDAQLLSLCQDRIKEIEKIIDEAD